METADDGRQREIIGETSDRRTCEVPTRLENDKIAATLSDRGAILQIENKLSGQGHDVRSDWFFVRTDGGDFDSRTLAPAGEVAGDLSASFVFQSAAGQVALEYRLRPDAAYVDRWLRVENGPQPLTLLEIALGHTAFDAPPREVVKYDTFWNCPTVAFLRWERGGLFAGIENPFFRTDHRGGEVAFSFEPSLILAPRETYESEPQFIGVYRASGVMLTDRNPRTSQGRRPRFRNPCGHIPIDRSEIRAMQRFALDYLGMQADRFHFILYNFFYPLPQMPQPNSPEEAVHLKMIDVFHELGGDMIIFNPMYPYTRPSGTAEAFWDLGPEGSAARRITDHARAKGISFGCYMGCARHGSQGNACSLPFVPERPQWKKQDDAGALAAENCIACDEYADWYFRVQLNTIQRFGLGLWSWDPGPGNGCFCHSDKHGHLSGKGAYKGWRNATAILRRIREACPGIYLQAYYGRKEHGLWGFKYFDQHESYWELGLWMCSIHADLHADRINADGVRHQGWWNQNFRFHPAWLTHAMVHRFQEGWYDPRLSKAWDHRGWKYSVMSCLAAGGSMTAVILPEDLRLVPEMKAFYGKWLAWARQNVSYVNYNVPFGAQVQPGGVDGWARIKGDHGFIFLANPGPRPARIEFSLDDEVGLERPGHYLLKELYPAEGRCRFDWKHGPGVFAQGDRVCLVVPAYEVVLLELCQASRGQAAGESVVYDVPGAPRSQMLLDDWRRADGGEFAFPRHAAQTNLCVYAQFFADPATRDWLSRAAPPNTDELAELIPKWKQEYPIDNFAWAQPHKLWLVLPFQDPDLVAMDAVRVDGKQASLQCHEYQRKIIYYADLTEVVSWGRANTIELEFSSLAADQFLGPYLDCPEAPADDAAGGDLTRRREVIYDGPLDPPTPQRALAGASHQRQRPVVTKIEMDPPHLREGVETRVFATVDMPAHELEGVYISGNWHDVRMTYDPQSQRWCWTTRIDSRAGLIMDVDRYYVWAVATSGLVGPATCIGLQWRFGKP